MRSYSYSATVCLFCSLLIGAEPAELTIGWEKNFLTIRGDFPGGELKTLYLEAYCRPGSTNREWKETVIPHTADLIETSSDGKVIRLRDKLADGVVVEHTITTGKDDVDFRLVAHNPTNKASEAQWAQPCIRVDQFTGTTKADAKAVVPQYARKCFLFVDGQLTRLPTEPWALTARYVPGQVYAAPGVDRNDVNPRPLSSIVPTSGLCGCFSGDEKQMMAVVWEPYQEIFQGVLVCIHSDFRIGGLAPGETKRIHGKIYIMPADVPALVKRYERDFALPTKP
jgi:hypothetical protein